MKRKRRTHKPEFKAKVAMTAIQGDLTIAEMVKKFDVHSNQITEWKKQLLGGAAGVFGETANKSEESAEAIQELHAKIGQPGKEGRSAGCRSQFSGRWRQHPRR